MTGAVDPVQTVWVHREIASPSSTLWELLTDTGRWPEWGPSVRRAAIADGPLRMGSRGTVTTVLGLSLPFEITDFVEGTRWGWRVAGIPATDHSVEALSPQRCRVGFGVPWPAAGYLAVCRVALGRLESISCG